MTFWPSVYNAAHLICCTVSERRSLVKVKWQKPTLTWSSNHRGRFIFYLSLSFSWQDHMWNLHLPAPPASECMNAFLRAYINGPQKGHIWYPAEFVLVLWCCSGMFFDYNTIMRWIFSKACLFQTLLSPWIMPVQLNAGTGLIVKCKSITSHFSFVLELALILG